MYKPLCNAFNIYFYMPSCFFVRIILVSFKDSYFINKTQPLQRIKMKLHSLILVRKWLNSPVKVEYILLKVQQNKKWSFYIWTPVYFINNYI